MLLKSWPWWLVALSIVLAAAVAPWGKLFESRLKRDDDRRAALSSGTLNRRVREYRDLRELGVHRALPTYVPRDRDTDLAELLKQGIFIVVLGDSAAGKTRFAVEGLRSTLPGHRLIAPDRAALPAAVDEMANLQDAVLWLDDLENYLGTNGGLTTTMIARLRGNGRCVLATMRIQELKRMEEEDNDRLLNEDRRKVLARAEVVNLNRQFTAAELARARARADDCLIAEALSHTDKYGLAEYLAAGPQLLDRWQRGWSPRTNPRGAALVLAAIDCRRAGYLGPLPKTLLDDIHEHYLQAPRLYPEHPDDAWAWATTPWHDTTALLEETTTGAVTVFDYVVDHVQRTSPQNHPVPTIVLRLALNHAEPADVRRIAHTAYWQRRYALAHDGIARALADQVRTLGPGHPDTIASRHNLAFIKTAQGELDEATAELEDVCEISDRILGPQHPDSLISRNNYARALILQRRPEEAVTHLRTALRTAEQTRGKGHECAMISRNNLAIAEVESGRPKEAVAHYRELLRIQEQTLGPDHDATVATRSNLAGALEDICEYAEAIAERREVVRVTQRRLGPHHHRTFMSLKLLNGALARAQLLNRIGFRQRTS